MAANCEETPRSPSPEETGRLYGLYAPPPIAIPVADRRPSASPSGDTDERRAEPLHHLQVGRLQCESLAGAAI